MRYLVIIPLGKRGVALHLNKLEFPFTQGCIVPSLVKLVLCLLRRRFVNFGDVFLLFCNCLPRQTWIPLHPRTPKWFLTGRFLNFVNVFSLFRNYLPLEKGVAIHLYKLEFPSTKDDLCQVWLKLAQWFWRTRFLHFVNVFSPFRNYLSLEKGVALHINKYESPLPKNGLCQVWLKLAQWFLRRRFLNFVNIFSPFRNYLPLEKGVSLHLQDSNICSEMGKDRGQCLSQGTEEDDPRGRWGLHDQPSDSWEDENVKSLQTVEQTDRQTDGRTTAYLSFQLGRAKT